jgi:hypothetical protein
MIRSASVANRCVGQYSKTMMKVKDDKNERKMEEMQRKKEKKHVF